MSSNLADDTTIASTFDVANMEDFRDYYPPIEEETEAPWKNWKGSAGYGGSSSSGWIEAPEASSSQTSWSSGGWGSEPRNKWQRGWHNRRHMQNGAARSTLLLVAATLLRPSEAVSTVAIAVPSTSVLLLLTKLYVFSTTVRVVSQVSEEALHLVDTATDAAVHLVDTATDAAEEVMVWTFWR